MDKQELQELIKASASFLARSSNGKKPLKEEKQTIKFAFASAATTKNLKKDKIKPEKFLSKRPGNGDFNIKNYKKLLNKKVKRDIKKILK